MAASSLQGILALQIWITSAPCTFLKTKKLNIILGSFVQTFFKLLENTSTYKL